MQDLSQGRVLITYGRSLMAVTAAQSLGRRGVEVIGLDDVDFTALSFSKWVDKTLVHKRAALDPYLYINDLERIVLEQRPEDDRPYVLMPMFNDAKLIAQHADRFAPHIKVTAPPAAAIGTVDPKDTLARTARRIGLSTPLSFACDTVRDLNDALAEMTFPCLVKPADAVGGRGIVKAENAEAARSAWWTIRQHYPGAPVLQAMAPGDDYCYCVLVIDGDLVTDMAYRNTVNYPADFGAGVVRETVEHRRFRDAAAPLLALAGWTGVAEIDFMWTGRPDDAPLLIEVNPRFWANLDHSVGSGIDFPWLLYEATVTGRVAEAPTAQIGYRSKLPGLWLLAALETASKEGHGAGDHGQTHATLLDRLGAGKLKDGLRRFGEHRDNGLDLRQAFQTLKRQIADARAIDTIAADQDDPLVGLGVLFILGSLLRYGELPAELRR